MSETFFILPTTRHHDLVKGAYLARGFSSEEANAAASFAEEASRHGIRTHNAIKALHLDDLFGSKAGGCAPGAEIEIIESRFSASETWNANRKLGQPTAYAALNRAIELADVHGIAQISVDNAFHYLWGGGYMIEAARRGYIAYTNCTAALAEVVPFGGKHPTLGTNPHSWGFPTTEAIGFPIVIDWATSVIAMGRVQQLQRAGKKLPPEAAVDKDGNPTTEPDKVAALTTFGAHKGYGLSMINELMAGFIGGSLPTLRSRWQLEPDEKHTPCFYFQVVHPEALSGGAFAKGRSQAENVRAVIENILSQGNEGCLLPGQMEAEAARKTDILGGLLFSVDEIDALNEIAGEAGVEPIDRKSLKTTEI